MLLLLLPRLPLLPPPSRLSKFGLRLCPWVKQPVLAPTVPGLACVHSQHGIKEVVLLLLRRGVEHVVRPRGIQTMSAFLYIYYHDR